MNNWTKYIVYVHHTMNFDPNRNYKPCETRVAKICDSADEAIDVLLDIVKFEPDFTKDDMLLFDSEKRNHIKKQLEKYGDYSIQFKMMHDQAKMYNGPGAYSLDTMVLS